MTERKPSRLLQAFDAAIVGFGAIRIGIIEHIDIWREAVRLDKLQPKMSPIGRAELAFLPAALEVSETPASPASRVTALLIAGFVTISVAWASLGELDIVAAAPGKIIPSERVKVIQPLETSIVSAVRVVEGQAVTAGQVLVELQVSGGQSDVDKLMAELDTARGDIARLEALLTADPDKSFNPPPEVGNAIIGGQRLLMRAQLGEHHAKLAALEADLARKQAELRTTETEIVGLVKVQEKITDETARRQELAQKGYGSQIDRLKAEKEHAQNTSQQQVQWARLVETRAGITALRSQLSQVREEFRRDTMARLSESKMRAASLEQDLIKAADRQRVQTLLAPVDGFVQQIEIHTIGGVVTPAQRLMVVVPKGAVLEVEAKLPNKDIAFVEVGQDAAIKIDAFPFTRYGTLDAKVILVSLDAVKDEESPTKEFYFPLRLSLSDTAITVENGKRVPLTPGMTVMAEVKTGTRTPMEYVLAPLKKYGGESGRER